MDLLITLPAMPVVLVLLLVCGAAIKINSRGPILFVQARMGQHGRPFRLYKLRTMVQNAEQLKASTLDDHTVHFKTLDDPRITGVGRWLRKTSLDELPQLFNVIRGEMSLVGPRPTQIGLVSYEPWHQERLAVPQGITGLWQLRGRNAVTFDERVRLDLEYIENMSLATDLKLLARTVGAILRGTGA